MKKPIFFKDFLNLLDANIPIYSVLDQLGIEYNSHRQGQLIRCPFHQDSNPSAKVYTASNSLFCFSERKRFGIFNFLRLKAPAREIIAWGEDHFGVKVVEGKSLLEVKPAKLQIISKFVLPLEWDKFLAFAEEKLVSKPTPEVTT